MSENSARVFVLEDAIAEIERRQPYVTIREFLTADGEVALAPIETIERNPIGYVVAKAVSEAYHLALQGPNHVDQGRAFYGRLISKVEPLLRAAKSVGDSIDALYFPFTSDGLAKRCIQLGAAPASVGAWPDNKRRDFISEKTGAVAV